MRVTKNYMENVLKKLIRDIEAKEYEWCSGGMQITIALDKEEASFLLEAIERLEEKDNAPTIDAVPVIRCRDCRWWDKEREQCGITPSSSPYGHCHDGETLEHSMIKDAGR